MYVCSAKAIIYENGKILFGKYEDGSLILPGGKIEENESIEEALKRELKEEFDIDVEILKILYAKKYKVRDQSKISIYYLCKRMGNIKPKNEMKEFLWLSKKDIEKIKLPLDYKKTLLKLFELVESKIKIKIVAKGKVPEYKSLLASGADLYANIEEPIVIKPFERKIIPTGIFIELPSDLEAQIRPRSGLAAKYGITVLNTPGTIDADYRGEIKVILINLSNENFVVEPNMRIAQLVIAPVIRAEFDVVDELEETDRKNKGFGSTGLK